jgi:hypothetical protein
LIDNTGSLTKLLDTAPKLRNKRIHAIENIRNLSGAKTLEPLNGVAFWAHRDDKDRTSHHTRYRMIAVDPALHDLSLNLSSLLPYDGPLPGKIGIFAFGKVLDVSLLIETLQETTRNFAEAIVIPTSA